MQDTDSHSRGTFAHVTYRLSIRLSPDARRGVDNALDRHGVTLTALMEAWGLEHLRKPVDIEERVVEHARIIDTERRSRR